MKTNYSITAIAAALTLSAMSAAAQDHNSMIENFFPEGNVTPEMRQAIEAIPYIPAARVQDKKAQAAPFTGGMNGDWRPAEVVGLTEKGVNLYKYIYYYDKEGTYYSKDQSQVRVYQQWNSTDGVWENRMRFKLILNERGDIVEAYTDTGFKDQWNNKYRICYTFDDNHNMLTSEQFSWYEDAWFSTLKWENTYDADGNILTQTYFNRPLGGEWTRGSKHTWAYDEAGNMILHEVARWSDLSQKYSPYLTDKYSYNAAGNLLTESKEQYGTPTYLYTYTYDESGTRKLTFLHQKWNGGESVWADYMSGEYSYDDQGRPKEDIFKLWENGEWNLSQKTAYVYWELADKTTYSKWDKENEKWQDLSQYIERRDAEGHIVCESKDEMDNNLGRMQTQTQTVYVYQNNLLVSKKFQEWNGAEKKFKDITAFSFTYNDDRNCNNVTAAPKTSKEWIFAPYNDMADEWGCADFDPYAGNLTYLNLTEYVEPTGITLDTTECALEQDYSKQITATVHPANVSNPEYYWKSSDESVARVSVNGKVYAVAKGEAIITAITMDNKFSAQCKVTVSDYDGIAETNMSSNFAYTDGIISFTPATERHSISVYDISGKAVCENDSRTVISTEMWTPGLYIVKTADGNSVKTYKLIVK